MAKNVSLKKILGGVAALLGLVAFIMLFVPQLVGDHLESLNGIKVTFGYSKKFSAGSFETKQKILNFSFLNLLTYIFVLAGIVCSVLAVMGKGGNILSFIAAGLFIAGGVFFFCTISFTSVEGSKDTFKEIYKLGAGAIVGGILSILAGAAMVGQALMKK